jgi:hypothetical protein
MEQWEYVGDMDFDLYRFSDFVQSEGTAQWYKEMTPELPDEWCELFELHSLYGGLNNPDVVSLLEVKRRQQEETNTKNLKIIEGDDEATERAFLETLDLRDFFSDFTLDELYSNGQPTDISGQCECGRVPERNQEVEHDILPEREDCAPEEPDRDEAKLG